MQIEGSHRRNNLGIAGWFWGGNYKLERYLFIVHRVTGLGLLLFFLLHLIETTVFRIQGESVWQSTMRLLKNPVFEAGVILVSFAFVIHAANGLRLVLLESGWGIGKPKRPVYPYKDTLRSKRIYAIASIAVIVILLVVFTLNRFIGAQ